MSPTTIQNFFAGQAVFSVYINKLQKVLTILVLIVVDALSGNQLNFFARIEYGHVLTPLRWQTHPFLHAMRWLSGHGFYGMKRAITDDFDTQSGFLQLTKVTTCQMLYDPVPRDRWGRVFLRGFKSVVRYTG